MQSAPSSVEVEEVDLSGLMESVVDSDEEEDLSETTGLLVRDAVRECLEKDPSDRTEEDVDILLEFTQHLKAFTNMTMYVRRALVATMVFAVVEKAGTVVMTDGEELDSWSVIINGQVEIEKSGCDLKELHLGDSFGIKPTMDKLYHKGIMRTKCDDCQFVCVTQTDYYRILHQGEENQKRHEDEHGRVVLVTEQRTISNEVEAMARKGHVVIRGTTEKLMSQLMEDNSNVDPTFTEDFLLTYRTFLDSPVEIMSQLLNWFKDPSLRDKVTRVLLLWVNNHFTDFETDPGMMEYLEKFESSLEAEKMQGQLRMLNFACAAKARKRTVTVTRPSRDEPLQFSVVGGYERGFGIFIAKVDKASKADEVGLKRGDQILEVNGQSFEHVTKHSRALEILKSVCHLSITVKSNLLAFNEMMQSPEDANPRARTRGKSVGSGSSKKEDGTEGKEQLSIPGGGLSDQNAYSGSEGTLTNSAMDVRSQAGNSRDNTPVGSNRAHKKDTPSSGKASHKHSSRINRAFNRFLHKPKSLMNMDVASADDSTVISAAASTSTLYPGGGAALPNGGPAGSNALSNPDLREFENNSHQHQPPAESTRSEYPEHVLKVYKADQTFKYLLVHKETTAHEVVMLSLQEFGMTEPSSNYTLCEVTVADGGFVKQRRLPDALQNLAERIGLASRYYIKNIHSSESLLPDEVVSDLVKDAQVNLLQLNPVEVSTQLMVEDFTIFRQIEATEYVEDLFDIKSRYGTPSLSLFSDLVNREMMWAISEVVSEPNAAKRMRVIKQYIKVARQCRESQNFNSMFAIVSGLGHGAVSRLKSTWERLPTKYQRLFSEMQQLMDPSRNMSRYRNLVNGEDVQPPIIPFYPVVKKDLTFINLANDCKVEDLVNFEKLRMIAKEVRSLTNMCSAPLDLFSMLELGGQQPSNAMVAMNQLTAGGQYLATVNRNRRKKASGLPNPKRMFEEAQMVRRVKAYLNNMKIIFDEDKLHSMSLECEPPQGGSVLPLSITQPSIRKRNPSPTPSAISSTSSAASHNSHNQQGHGHGQGHGQQGHGAVSEKKVSSSSAGSQISGGGGGGNNPHLNSLSNPKFGAASPHAVKKLLSLSEQSRPRPKSGLGSSHPAHPSPMSGRKPVNQGGANSNGGGGGGGHFVAPGQTSPVDLTAESSSVTSLPVMRKPHHNGSVASTDSGLGFYDVHAGGEANGGHGHPDFSSVRREMLHSTTSASPRLGHPRRSSTHHRKPRISSSTQPLQHQHSLDGVVSQILSASRVGGPMSAATPPLHSIRHAHNHYSTRMIGGKATHMPPPLPPHHSQGHSGSKAGSKPRGNTIPTYYVTDPDEEDDDDEDEETQVSAV